MKASPEEVRLFRPEKIIQYAREFIAIFNVPLARFYSYPFGFDIMQFDEWLRVPDGVSTKNFILAEYPHSAEVMIEDLLNMPIKEE